MLFLFTILLQAIISVAQNDKRPITPPVLQTERTKWVDSVIASLSLEQKIGQLFMVAAYSGGEKYNKLLIDSLIQQYHIGGLIFMQGTPSAQAKLCNEYQHSSKIPLFIAMDAEWGLGMRLTGVRDFPRQLMMGAMQDSNLVYNLASAVANQCRRMGVHINFAPVADINNNPNNPVINFRSFGEQKNKVANYAIQYMRGLQENGVIACGKHFPGHGDTDVDSHKDLPEISKSIKELESLEFVPFEKLIANGLQSIMIAHLQVPALENKIHTPSTLSEKTIEGVLKTKMGFQGLIFTDALNMQGIAKFYSPGEIDLKAFMAGNDVLLFSQDVPTGLQKIKEAIRTGKITEQRLHYSLQKILFAKYDANLHLQKSIDTENLETDLNKYVPVLRKQIAENAITLLNDPNQIIQKLKSNTYKKAAYVGVGTTKENFFSNALKEAGVQTILFAPTNEKENKRFIRSLKEYDIVIVGIHNMAAYPTSNYGLDPNEISMVQTISSTNNCLSVLFGNPYALKNFCSVSGFLVAYDEAEETQQIAAKIISGQLKAKGKLPVSVCPRYQFGDGIVSLTSNLGEIVDTIRYAKQNKSISTLENATKNNLVPNDFPLECCISPNAIGINNAELDKLDIFLEGCVRQGAFPGCRMLAAKQGKVFYDKSFGYLTPDKNKRVESNTIYDVASVTKAAATTLAVMKLYEQGKINLNDFIGKYVPITKGYDKEYLKIKDILLHEAGLKSWIPFYKETLDSFGYPKPSIYNKSEIGNYRIKVAPNLFMRTDWVDTMWKRILYSPLENRGAYVYSDLDFLFLQKLVERVTNKSLADYVKEEFYNPLGLKHTAFQARKNLIGKDIAPTEQDNYFRYQKIEGYVHDMGAAMLGGIAGHAGLFSSANEIGIIFQMLLNGGIYNGKRYFQKSTVDLFTSKGSNSSRRGLGFDKPEARGNKANPCADNASLKTFGHQGFTGTCVWADPAHDILIVFLSNRTYPSAENKTINRLHVREKAQEYIYNAIGIASRYRN
jgi:beta-N-acetylhexosaminidase